MRTLCLLSAFTLLLLTGCDQVASTDVGAVAPAPTAAGNGNSGPSASGAGHVTLPDADGEDANRTFSFHARTKKNGDVDGRFNLHARQAEGHFKGDIACMNVIGNQAVLAGFITKAPEGASFREGGNFGFRVEDNGEGNGDAPDRLSLVSQFPVPQPGFPDDQSIIDFLCASDGAALAAFVEVENGNIQVRP